MINRHIQGFLILLLLITATSFRLPKDNKLIVYKPSRDFSFLSKYYCIHDFFSEEQWTNNKGRSFDKNGVHLTNNNYHPVNACHYALYCYDEYKITGDERLKKAFLSQVSYLRDSSKYHEIDGYKVGYPYLTSFHDLVAPWYSALAQSEAISVLIRYYVLTGDKSILPLIVKLKNFMIAPQADGKGTMSYTPEGNIWFEEYPNSPQERQVLNGFFLALVALYEYSHLFPDDDEVKNLYIKAVKSAKESIKFYDTGSWLKYNRGDQRLVANAYVKWQVLEMKFLYEITKDNFFRNQYMLWSTYAYNKPYETSGCKITNYNFSVPLQKLAENSFAPAITDVDLKLDKVIAKINTSFSADMTEVSKMIDGNPVTAIWCISKDSVSEVEPLVEFTFKEEIKCSSIAILFKEPITDYNYQKIEMLVDDMKAGENWKKIKPVSVTVDASRVIFNFDNLEIQNLTIQIPGLKRSAIKIADIKISAPSNDPPPVFYHYTTEVFSKTSDNAEFQIDYKDMDDCIVYYRTAFTNDILNKTVWSQEKMNDGIKINLTDKEKLVQFLIIGRRKSDSSTIKSIRFVS